MAELEDASVEQNNAPFTDFPARLSNAGRKGKPVSAMPPLKFQDRRCRKTWVYPEFAKDLASLNPLSIPVVEKA